MDGPPICLDSNCTLPDNATSTSFILSSDDFNLRLSRLNCSSEISPDIWNDCRGCATKFARELAANIASGNVSELLTTEFFSEFTNTSERYLKCNCSYNDIIKTHYNWSFLFVIVFITAGGIGNVLVCLAVLLDRKLQNVTNYFLLSLGIADLLVSMVVMPLGAVSGFLGKFQELTKLLDIIRYRLIVFFLEYQITR